MAPFPSRRQAHIQQTKSRLRTNGKLWHQFQMTLKSPIWQSITFILGLLVTAITISSSLPELIKVFCLITLAIIIIGIVLVWSLYQIEVKFVTTGASLLLIGAVVLSGWMMYPYVVHSLNSQSNTAGPGETLYAYQGHHEAISSLQWSSDGKRITSYYPDGTVQTWDATTDNQLPVSKYYDQTLGATIKEVPSPDGSLVAESVMLPWPQNPYLRFRKGVIRVFDATTGKDILPQDRQIIGDVNQVIWSPDSSLIASSEGPEITIWDARTGKVMHRYSGNDSGCCPTDNYVYALAWSPDGRFIASAGMGGPMQIWEVATEKLYATYRPQCPSSIEGDTVDYINWQTGPSQMVIECFSASDHVTIKVLSVDINYNYGYDSNQTIPIFSIDETSSSAFCNQDTDRSHFYQVVWTMSPDDGFVAYTCEGTPSVVSIWNIAKKRIVLVYKSHTAAVTALDWSPIEQLYVASGRENGTIQVWRAE